MTDIPAVRLKRRHAAERRFRVIGLVAIVMALGVLAVLLTTVIVKSSSAFVGAQIALDVTFDADAIDPADLGAADWQGLAKKAAEARFGVGDDRRLVRSAGAMLSSGAAEDLRKLVQSDPSVIGGTRRVWVTASVDVDQTMKGHVPADPDADGARLNAAQMEWLTALRASGDAALHFNRRLFTSGDSREPELAGLWGAVVGSLYSLTITLAISFPIGVAAAIYLEEFAPRNKFTHVIEVNINNLAAVPSIVFGLLGLEIFLNVFGLPRSAPLVAAWCWP